MIHAGSAYVKGRVLIVWVSNDTIEATKEALMNAVQMFSAMPFILSDIKLKMTDNLLFKERLVPKTNCFLKM